MAYRTFAAIDVGSFELEMIIYEISSKYGIRQLDCQRHVIALGRDTFAQGKIHFEHIDEMCRVLERFTETMKEYGVTEYRAYATSAMREAKNNLMILDQIRVRTGLDVHIISNSEQRFISYKAIAMKSEAFSQVVKKGTGIVDVSFGSLQVSLFDKDTLASTQNMYLGALRIRSMLSSLHSEGPVTTKLVEELVDNDLLNFKKLYLKDKDINCLICTGECILYMVKDCKRTDQGAMLTREEFMEFYDELLHMSIGKMEETFGISTYLATLMIPSAMIYKRMLEIADAESIWVPGVRLCDGMAAEYALDKKLMKQTHDFDSDILAAARNISNRYQGNKKHNRVLEDNVCAIFDYMKKYHGMGRRERLLLQLAAILHGCGKYISMRNSGECAYNIIMSTEIIGLSHREREIVANIVKYNTDRLTYLDKEGTLADTDTYVMVTKLTAILRIANALDRSHKQKFKNIKLSIKKEKLVITTDYTGDISLEMEMFTGKADFFEEIYGIRPVIKQKRGV